MERRGSWQSTDKAPEGERVPSQGDTKQDTTLDCIHCVDREPGGAQASRESVLSLSQRGPGARNVGGPKEKLGVDELW